MISGKLAAEAIIEAKSQSDFSAALSRYRELLEQSLYSRICTRFAI